MAQPTTSQAVIITIFINMMSITIIIIITIIVTIIMAIITQKGRGSEVVVVHNVD